MASSHNLSVEEILAACRQADGEGGGASAPPPAQEPVAETAPAKKAPAKPTAAAKKPSQNMSIEEMLAAARAEKSGGAAASQAAEEVPAEEASVGTPAKLDPQKMSVADMLAAARGEKKAAPKTAAKPKPAAAAKPATKATNDKAGPKKPAGPLDTTSILAAARGGAKPGPISKAEAAAKGKPAAPVKEKPKAPPMPAKPAYARRPAPAAAEEGETRRGFMAAVSGMVVGSSLALGFSSLAVTNLLWVLGLARFMFPNILIEPPTQFRVGFPDDYGPGQVEEKFKAQFGVWIVRHEYEGTPEIYALKSVCTHLGCTPNWLEAEQKFKCPCHGSGFYKDGIHFEGPAPRPLERYAIRKADDGQLEVDKSRVFFEEKGQWSDPASYVEV